MNDVNPISHARVLQTTEHTLIVTHDRDGTGSAQRYNVKLTYINGEFENAQSELFNDMPGKVKLDDIHVMSVLYNKIRELELHYKNAYKKTA